MFRILLALILCLLTFITSRSQTGPGGVGSSSTMAYWLKASDQGAFNGASISTITDFSGNGNDFTQASSTNQATFTTGAINGQSVYTFNLSTYYVQSDYTPLEGLTALSSFFVGSFDAASADYATPYVFATSSRSRAFLLRRAASNSQAYFPTAASNSRIITTHNTNNNIHTALWNATAGTYSFARNETVLGTSAIATGNLNGMNKIILGRESNTSSTYFKGLFAEFVIFNFTVNITQRIIINNYLSSKYGIALSANDKYTFDGTHGNEVAGIGQTSATDNHTAAQGTSILLIENPTNLNDGEFAMWGHDAAGTGSNGNDFVSDTIQLNQEWRWDETGGDLGAVDMTFDMTGIELDPNPLGYILVRSSTGTFTNATIIANPTINGSLITFVGVDLNDGDFFTIAYDGLVNDCISLYNLLPWSDAGEWTCGAVPDSTVNAIIDAGDDVTIAANATVNDLTLRDGAILRINSNVALKIFGNLTVGDAANFICGTNATVEFVSNFGEQTITKTGTGNLDIFNLTINNASGVELTAGNINLINALNLNAGTLTLTGTMIFQSDASRTAHIETVIGNVIGNITVQRFASARQAGWNDIASPVVGTTISDIDNELYISGVSGADGYAASNGGGGFISLYTFDTNGGGRIPVSNVTDAMTNGVGFEIWLADNLTAWTAKAWDMSGTINLADVSQQTLSISMGNSGWNFVGNPYPATLNFGNISANAGNIINDEFWTVEAATNTYVSKNSLQPIPSGQGFWVVCSNSNDLTIDPSNDFVFSSSSIMYKNEYIPNGELRVLIQNKDSEEIYGSNVYLRKSEVAYSGQDAQDIPALRRPDPKNCHMAFEANGVEHLVNYVSTNEDHLELPIVMESGMTANFSMSFEGIDQFNEYQCINLLNNETGEKTPLTESSVLEFKLTENTPVNMTLILSKEDYEDCLAPTQYSRGNVAVSTYGKTVFTDFSLEKGATAHIEIFDILGNSVVSIDKNVGYNRESFNLNHINSGVYLVSITINGETQTEKVILQ